MATLIVSGICVLSFIGIIVWYAWVKGKNKQTKKLLHWATIGVSILFMILFVSSIIPTNRNVCLLTFSSYFGLDLTDRILHELKIKVSSMYFRISIPLETFTLIGDLMLLTFLLLWLGQALLDHVGISPQRITFLRMAHATTLMFLLALFIGDRIAFIYKSVTDQFLTPASTYAKSTTNSQLGMILGAYAKLNTAFYGLYLAGAISISTISVIVLLQLKKAQVLHRTFRVFLPILSVAITVRTTANFIYALYFKLLKHPQSLTYQLIHMLFYGLLSIAIYVSCLNIAATDQDWDSIVNTGHQNVEYGPASNGNTNFQDWRQHQTYKQQSVGVVSVGETGSYSSVGNGTNYGNGGHVQQHGQYSYEYQPHPQQHNGHGP
jgi:hypothetical protein